MGKEGTLENSDIYIHYWNEFVRYFEFEKLKVILYQRLLNCIEDTEFQFNKLK